MKSFLNIQQSNLLLKLAETKEEIEKARQLRYTDLVQFHNKDIAFDECFDDTDFVYDNLIVVDTNTNEVVGTYRLGRREHLKKLKQFAIESKFDISSIKATNEEILELSHNAVREGYRDGSVIRLLWKGIGEYCLHYRIRYMFAVISLYTYDVQNAKNFLSYIYYNHVSTQFDLYAKEPIVEMNLLPQDQIDMEAVRKEMHPALKSYMGMGCKFSKTAHIDDKMLKSVDVMIVIDYLTIPDKYRKLLLG